MKAPVSLVDSTRSSAGSRSSPLISYSLEGHDIRFDLLLLFTEDSIERLTHKLAYLMN